MLFTKDGKFFDMHSKQKHELFVPLIAKALAKWMTWFEMNGEGAAMGEGCHLYLFRALTGSDHSGAVKWHDAPEGQPGVIDRKDALEPVRRILASRAACTTGGAAPGDGMPGLEIMHSYTVLWYGKAADMEFVQLRNPWGAAGDWRGEWSDESAKWDEHPEVEQAMKEDDAWNEAAERERLQPHVHGREYMAQHPAFWTALPPRRFT